MVLSTKNSSFHSLTGKTIDDSDVDDVDENGGGSACVRLRACACGVANSSAKIRSEVPNYPS